VTGRSRCAIRQGAPFGTQVQRAPLFFRDRADWICPSRPRRDSLLAPVPRLSDRNEIPQSDKQPASVFRKRNFTAVFSLSLLRALEVDRGWSMKLSSAALPILLFVLVLTAVQRANDQQAQQSCVNAAICLLAARSGLVPDRRSDLQGRSCLRAGQRVLIGFHPIHPVVV
jgi:hypothetical protein